VNQLENKKIAVFKLIEPVAKLQFCNFNGVDGLRRNKAGRGFGADGGMEGADKNGVLQLPRSYDTFPHPERSQCSLIQ